MKMKTLLQRTACVLTAAVIAVMMLLPFATPVLAANTQFITDIRLEAGADAVDKLEKDGYSVMLTGLNMTYDPEKQVYLGYKMNDGDPITNIIVAADDGESLNDGNDISYSRASEIDVDEGIGGGSGCLYFTHDEKAGSPLVGLDVLRSKEEAIYPITNDGAEIVRTANGTPADLESASENAIVYLAQIRDNIVRPYISEIGVVTDTDKWNAVYTACERGYNYYVEGDIDDSKETYTILVYKRTANVSDAVTNIAAVSAETVEAMEQEQIVDASANTVENLTGAAIGISGIEYVRVSSKPIEGEAPYYLYQTKNKAAGNPVSMLYAEKAEEEQNSLFGTWVNGYFSTESKTSAYTYSVNEDAFAALREDLTVMTKLPVQLFETALSAEPETITETTELTTQLTTEMITQTSTEVTSEEETEPADGAEVPGSEDASEAITEASTTETVTETTTEIETTTEVTTQAQTENKFVKIAMLTPRDGLPESAAELMGLRNNLEEAPVIERNERSERTNKFSASVFGKHGWVALLLGGVVIVAAATATVIIRKKKQEKER
jgi:hypothetical protein